MRYVLNNHYILNIGYRVYEQSNADRILEWT